MKHLSILAFILGSFNFSLAQIPQDNGILFINTLFQKQYSQAFNFFDENLKGQVTVTDLEQAETAVINQIGNYLQNIEINEDDVDGVKIKYYYSKFAKQDLDIKIAFNKQSKIIGFYFVPHKDFKQKMNSAIESLGIEYPIKSGKLWLTGTLQLPEGNKTKNILVIYIHGSGPQDRDETIYENKPFKDIASGLLEYGIASYRFDKRTKIAPEQFVDDSYTIDDEVTTDIVNLVEYFNSNDTFKNYKLILIGHSLGAMMLPKILTLVNTKVSGAIMMAGNARPLQDLIFEQYTYINELHPSTELKIEIGKIKKQITYLNSSEFNLHSPKEKLPLNLPSSYWMSLKKYNQLQIITKITIPVLIVQGEKDYQVTMKDFKLWKKSVKASQSIQFRSYRELNHLFMEVKKTSTPQDYQNKNHVAPYLIKDIAEWILQIK